MSRRYFNLYEYNIRNWKEIVVTLVFMVLNVVGFIYGIIDKTADYSYGMMVDMVARDHEYYRLFTYMFLHAGIKHLLANLLVLFGLGRILERCVGHVKMLIIYLLSGIGGGAMIMYIADEYSLTVGASGAIFGLMGALIVFMVLNRDSSMLYQLVLMLVINLASTFSDAQISIGAHMGGLLAGIIFGVILIRREND